MSNYRNISIQEMREFLKPDKGWKETQSDGNVKETVFQFPLKRCPSILVRVYSGIKTDSGESRGCGKDAIRVCAVRFQNGKGAGWIKTKRVHRVAGWQKNLKNRVVQVITESNERLT